MKMGQAVNLSKTKTNAGGMQKCGNEGRALLLLFTICHCWSAAKVVSFTKCEAKGEKPSLFGRTYSLFLLTALIQDINIYAML